MEKTILLRNHEEARAVYGERDRYLKMIRNHYDVRIFARDGVIRVTGTETGVIDAYSALLSLLERFRGAGLLSTADVENALLGRSNAEAELEEAVESNRLDPFVPKTEGQRRYVEAIRSHPVTFGIGPAGTGKTFLAVATAVSALVRGHVKRLILVRPAVEAGEKLGFLPGDMAAKVNPYLRPIFDALGAVMPKGQVNQYVERDVIEIAPLAYMRGRTLDNAFIILDEAQNATPKQMLMLLTRLGPRSVCVVTGDTSQTDLGHGEISGLEDAVRRLHDVEGVAVCEMGPEDIVRHEMVARILEAYGELPGGRPKSNGSHRNGNGNGRWDSARHVVVNGNGR